MFIQKYKEISHLKSYSYSSRNFKELKKDIKNIVIKKFKSKVKKVSLFKDFISEKQITHLVFVL